MKHILLSLSLILGFNSATYALDGAGTQENPFKISTSDDLFLFSDTVRAGFDSAYAIQTADILLEKEWIPFGDKNYYYKGTYDGQHFEIQNLTINNDTLNKIAFCGLAFHATLKNITLKDCNLSTKGSYAAGICNDAQYSTIDGCSVEGTIAAKSCCAGIIAQTGYNSVIKNCTNKASITVEEDHAGGISGIVQNGSIIFNCFNEGNITGRKYLGGIVGDIYYASLAYCGNVGNVTDISGKGYHIAGIASDLKGTKMTCCYNTGIIKGGEYQIGALAAGNSASNSTFDNCFYKENCASYGDGTKTYALGVRKGYVPQDDSERSVTTFDNDEMISSGALCYMLNKNIPNDSIAWFQKCGEGYPKTDSTLGIVYVATELNCDSSFNSNTTFQNTKPDNIIVPDHIYDRYTCKVCGHIDPNYVAQTNGVYEIGNADELMWFSSFVNDGHNNANAKLTNDIKLNDISIDSVLTDSSISLNIWTEIGKEIPYSGTFDGQGHSIVGLYLTYDTNKDYTYAQRIKMAGNGLFGTLDNAVVKNVNIRDSYIRGIESIGAIAGRVMSNVIIDNCHNHGTVYGEYQVGGIVGTINGNNNNILNSSNSGLVTNGNNEYNEGNLGGIIGNIVSDEGDSTYVKNCFNKGILSGRLFVGGIVGYCLSYTDINACYNIGEITANGNSAGIIFFSNNVDYKMTQCFNMGQITNVSTSTRNNKKEALCNGADDPETCLNNYYLNGDISSSVGTAMNLDQFTNGEVCFKLNNGITDGSQPYRQNLSEIRGEVSNDYLANDTIDKHPVLDKEHRVVYFDNTYYNFFDPTSLNDKVAYKMPSIHTEGKEIVIIGAYGMISLYDITGHCLLKKANKDIQNEIRLNVYKSGIYMIAINDNIYKIIVK